MPIRLKEPVCSRPRLCCVQKFPLRYRSRVDIEAFATGAQRQTRAASAVCSSPRGFRAQPPPTLDARICTLPLFRAQPPPTRPCPWTDSDSKSALQLQRVRQVDEGNEYAGQVTHPSQTHTTHLKRGQRICRTGRIPPPIPHAFPTPNTPCPSPSPPTPAPPQKMIYHRGQITTFG